MSILSRAPKTPRAAASKKAATPARAKRAVALPGAARSHLAGVLRHVVVSEKATTLGAHGQYVFAVAIDATKPAIRAAVAHAYGETPERVNIIRVLGKHVNQGRRGGTRKNWKKAIVTMPKGKTLKLYEGV